MMLKNKQLTTLYFAIFVLIYIASTLSADSGTWTRQQTDITDRVFETVFFADEDHGWAVGSGAALVRTSNGGETWTTIAPDTSVGVGWLTDVHFVNSQVGWLIGLLDGLVEYSNDGGNTWEPRYPNIDNDSEILTGIHFVDENNGWIVGGLVNEYAMILKTSDGGLSWNYQYTDTLNRLYDVFFIDENTGWAAGRDEIVLHTKDGGNSWELQYGGFGSIVWNKISFVDNKNGWIVSRNGDVLNTNNGGKSWTIQSQLDNIINIDFADHNNGWAVGNDGTVKRTINGGESWQTYSMFTTANLYDVHMVNPGMGWAVGELGVIYKYEADGPVSSFATNVSSGIAPVSIDFTDQSTGSLNNWQWDFGDGNTSNQQSPNYTFDTPGEYEVCLLVSSAEGSNESCRNIIVYEDEPPQADFAADPVYGEYPLTVLFQNQSNGQTFNPEWNFGDGTTSYEEDPEHTYEEPGAYQACLTVQNNYGFDEICNVILVTPKTPIAMFSVDEQAGQVPLTVTFTDSSEHDPDQWNWYFGDGDSSDLQNPVHTYTVSGKYTACLEVSNNYGSDSTCVFINAEPPPSPVADFIFNPSSGGAPLQVNFNDRSDNNPDEWYWDFGDGNHSIHRNPVHTYSEPGTYTVSLEVTNESGSDKITKDDLITVTEGNLIAGAPIENHSVTIYPNPANEHFTLEVKQKNLSHLTYKLYNSKGQLIKQEHVNEVSGAFSRELSLINQYSGVYFLTVQTNENVYHKKIVVQ